MNTIQEIEYDGKAIEISNTINSRCYQELFYSDGTKANEIINYQDHWTYEHSSSYLLSDDELKNFLAGTKVIDNRPRNGIQNSYRVVATTDTEPAMGGRYLSKNDCIKTFSFRYKNSLNFLLIIYN